MNVGGFELDGDWKVSNIGFTATSTRGGKKYFLKKYGEFKMPRRGPSTSDKLFARLMGEFNAFKENRIAINVALSDIACSGGNIILPAKWFVDDIYYIEATEYVPGLIEDEAIMRLSRDELLFVMLTAAGALKNIHSKGIIHSDLKRTNILSARNSSGRVVAKIIDFDKSYFAANIREDELGGDQSYMSPELTWCLMCDLAEDALARLSTQSDIFSLGVVFHNYLCGGDFPEPVGLKGALAERKTVYCGEALASGASLKLSKKITEPYLAHLIAAMLQPEPSDRPTAQGVMDALKTKTELPLPADSRIIIDTPKKAAPRAAAPAAAPAASRPASRPAAPAAAPARPAAAPAPAPAPAPAAPVIPTGFCEAWPEHAGTINEEGARSLGYVAAERTTRGTTNCYAFYTAEGKRTVFGFSNAKMLGLFTASASAAPAVKPTTSETIKEAKRKAVVSDSAEPWEEDSAYVLDVEKAKADGYTGGIARAEKNGKKGYVLIAPDKNTFLLMQTLKMLGYAKKK